MGSLTANPRTLSLADVFPFAISQTVNRVANNPGALSFADPFANVSDAAVSVGGVDLHASTQYLQSWNLTGERQLSRDTAVEAGYAGSKGTHLGLFSDLNRPYYSPAYRQPNGSFPRPYPQFTSVIN
jgi:hypothetical protein